MSWNHDKANNIYAPTAAPTPRLPAGMYVALNGLNGPVIRPQPVAADTLIDVPGTPIDDVTADVTAFLAAGAQYSRLGLTHKRGYLLYGPPGSGKTSLGIMLARRFAEQHDGLVMFAADSRSFIQGFQLLQATEPGRPAMYLLEEADAFLNSAKALSILDGELSASNTMFVAMTNYIGDLPPRLANRPGRFDRVVRVPAVSRAVQLAYLERLQARGEGLAVAEPIVTALEGMAVTISHLREAFIAHVILGQPISTVAERFRAMFAGQPEPVPSSGLASLLEDDDE